MLEFTMDELRTIKAMCVTACPQYPNVPMYEPWAGIYAKADAMLEALPPCECGHPHCGRYGYCPLDM